MGVPHRFRYFREALEVICARPDVLLWTGEQILDWYATQGQANLSQGATVAPRG
jgi:allantoinase